MAVVCKQESSEKKSTEAEIFYTFFAQLLFFSFYFCFLHFFCVVLCQQCNQVDDALSEKKRSRLLLLPLRLLLVCKSRLEECNAGRQRDRQRDGETGRQPGSVVHDGAGLKGLRRSVRNPRNYPFIGLGATVAAVAVAVAVAGVRVGR